MAFTDDFNRASLGSNWSNLGTALITISSNQAVHDGGGGSGGDASASWVGSGAPTTGAHHIAGTATNVENPSGRELLLLVRLNTSTFNGYYADMDNALSTITEITGGAPTVRASTGTNLTLNGELVRCVSESGSVYLVNDTDASTVVSYSSTTYNTNTVVAIGINRNASSSPGVWDDVYGGDGTGVGANEFTGSAAVTDARDTVAASGTFVSPEFAGSSSTADDVDTATASGTFTDPAYTGSGVPSDEIDTAAASGTFTSPSGTGTGSPTDTIDTASGSATFTTPPVTATGAPTDETDTAVASGTYTPAAITGSVAVTDQGDTSTGAGGHSTPGGEPEAPPVVRPVSAFGYDGEVGLTWTTPDDHGSAITGYVVHVSTDDGGTWIPHASPSASPATLTGLTINQRYTFRVAGVNANGTGPFMISQWGCTPVSAAAPITPPAESTRDASAGGQWGIDEVDGTTDNTATSTWTGDGVRIYIWDSNFRLTHTEFASQAFTNGYAINGLTLGDVSSGEDHGTKVASMAVGATCGLAVDAIMVPVASSDQTSVYNYVEALQWIYDNHPADTPGIVITSQLFVTIAPNDSDGRSPATQFPLIDALVTGIIEDKGMAFVQCIGNQTSYDHIDLDARPGLVLVSYSNESDQYASGSEFTPDTTIIAPGAGVLVASHTGDSAYVTSSGTSFAAPLTAGAMACWLEANPVLSPRQLVDILLATSVKDGLTGETGGAPNRELRALADIADTTTVAGSVTTTDGTDTAAGAGSFVASGVAGTAAATDEPDAAAGSATFDVPVYTATGAATDSTDTASSSGTFLPIYTGSGTPADSIDTAVGTGTSSPPEGTGAGSPTDVRDTSSGTATFDVPVYTATGTPTDTADTGSGAGTSSPPEGTGAGSPTDQRDTASASGTFVPGTITGTGTPTDTRDTSTSTATFTGPVWTATGAAADTIDTASGSATFTTPTAVGTGAATDGTDTLGGVGLVTAPVFTGSGSPTDERDTGGPAPGLDYLVSVAGALRMYDVGDVVRTFEIHGAQRKYAISDVQGGS